MSFVEVDDSDRSEVLTELIEVVVAVEEGTTLTKEGLEVLDADSVLVDVVDLELTQLDGPKRFSTGLELTTLLLGFLSGGSLNGRLGLAASVVGLLLLGLFGVLGIRLLLLLSNAAIQSLLALKGSAQLPLQLENLLTLGSDGVSGHSCSGLLNSSVRRCCFQSISSVVPRVRIHDERLAASTCGLISSVFLNAVRCAVYFLHHLGSSSGRSRCARSSHSSTTPSSSNTRRSVLLVVHVDICAPTHLVVNATLTASLLVLLNQIVKRAS